MNSRDIQEGRVQRHPRRVPIPRSSTPICFPCLSETKYQKQTHDDLDGLTKIVTAEKFQIALLRRDDMLHNPVTIWAVHLSTDLYVRSVNGRARMVLQRSGGLSELGFAPTTLRRCSCVLHP